MKEKNKNRKGVDLWFANNKYILLVCILSILLCIYFGYTAPDKVMQRCNQHWIQQWIAAQDTGQINKLNIPVLYNTSKKNDDNGNG